jgi:hypothetical protein
MIKRVLIVNFICGMLACFSAKAQTIINHCPYDQKHWNQLACLIPDLTRTGGSNIQGFNTALARVIAELPVAAPVSGLALTLDKSTGVYTLSSDLGGVLTERGSTLGKYKLFLGFTYQRFDFDEVDGTKLSNIPTVSVLSDGGFLASTNRLHAVIDQYTTVVAFGLSDRMDISLTLPANNVSLSGATTKNFQATNNSPLLPQSDGFIAGSASGIGDLLLNGKFGIMKGERNQIAGGLEVRFATGNEFNLLGSGAYGFRPYIVYSRLGGRFHPHANFGYQWNGQSVLNLSTNTGSSLRLPDSLTYAAGVDYSILRRLTVVGDFVGRHFFDAPTVTRAQLATSANVPTLGGPCTNGELGNPSGCNLLNGTVQTISVKEHDSFDEDAFAVGIKVNPFGNLLVSANVLIELNDAGLRANYVPLVGVSYKF